MGAKHSQDQHESIHTPSITSLKTTYQDKNEVKNDQSLSSYSSHTSLQTKRIVQENENSPINDSIVTLKVPSLSNTHCDKAIQCRSCKKSESIEETIENFTPNQIDNRTEEKKKTLRNKTSKPNSIIISVFIIYINTFNYFCFR